MHRQVTTGIFAGTHAAKLYRNKQDKGASAKSLRALGNQDRDEPEGAILAAIAGAIGGKWQRTGSPGHGSQSAAGLLQRPLKGLSRHAIQVVPF